MPKIKVTDKTKADDKPPRPGPKVPNATTRKALRDAEQGRLNTYKNVDELFKKLGS
jgi:hypothetical protein